MRASRYLIVAGLAFAAMAGLSCGAALADSYDDCAGFVDAVPIAITTQGIWCLKQNISTAATNIIAIDIQTNNVTIDCHGFKLGNLGAGTGTASTGVNASNGLANIGVRNCTIQGFKNGIAIGTFTADTPGTGHVVENNRLWSNRGIGVLVAGSAS